MNTAIAKASVLTEAFKYVERFRGKVVVVKFGGNAMESPELMAQVFHDIGILERLGMRIVLVHGGGPGIDAEMERRGLVARWHQGLRVTDAATLAIVSEVLGHVNAECVRGLETHHSRAQAATDGTFVTQVTDEQLGYVGEITQVDTAKLLETTATGIIPVIASLGRDESGQLTNINADTAASAVAIALQAEKLTILTNVDGVLGPNDRLVSRLTAKEAEAHIAAGTIGGGMIPKVRACAEAVRHGVGKAHLVNGTVPRALLIELFTDEGIGTEVVN